MIKYINIKTQYGVETLEKIERNDFNTFREYSKEVKRLIKEYKLMGYNAYSSQKKAK